MAIVFNNLITLVVWPDFDRCLLLDDECLAMSSHWLVEDLIVLQSWDHFLFLLDILKLYLSCSLQVSL